MSQWHATVESTVAPLGRVLIVDDEPDLLRSMARLVRRRGYEVLLAANAHEAIAQLTIFDVDVILCDVALPGMSRYRLAARRADP